MEMSISIIMADFLSSGSKFDFFLKDIGDETELTLCHEGLLHQYPRCKFSQLDYLKLKSRIKFFFVIYSVYNANQYQIL